MSIVIEMDTFAARADKAVREHARPTISGGSSSADVTAAFEHAAHIEPMSHPPALEAERSSNQTKTIHHRLAKARKSKAEGDLPWGRPALGMKVPQARKHPMQDAHIRTMRAVEATLSSAERLVSANRVRSLSNDICAAYVQHGLIEPRPLLPAAIAEVTTVDPDALRLWFVGTFAPRLHEKVGTKLADAGWEFRCPLATEWRDIKRPEKGQPKREPVKRPLFGTYGFLYPKDDANPDWMALDHIDGFGGLTRHSVTKVALRAPGVEIVKFGRLEAEGFFDATRSRPPKVKALDRVFATVAGARLAGIVQMTMGERVKVLLDSLGEATLPMDAVEAA